MNLILNLFKRRKEGDPQQSNTAGNVNPALSSRVQSSTHGEKIKYNIYSMSEGDNTKNNSKSNIAIRSDNITGSIQEDINHVDMEAYQPPLFEPHMILVNKGKSSASNSNNSTNAPATLIHQINLHSQNPQNPNEAAKKNSGFSFIKSKASNSKPDDSSRRRCETEINESDCHPKSSERKGFSFIHRHKKDRQKEKIEDFEIEDMHSSQETKEEGKHSSHTHDDIIEITSTPSESGHTDDTQHLQSHHLQDLSPLEIISNENENLNRFFLNHNQELRSLISSMHCLRDEIRSVKNKLSVISNEVENLTKRETQLIEANNFDKVLEIEGEISRKKIEIAKLENYLNNSLEKDMSQLRECEISLLKDKYKKIESYQMIIGEIKIEKTNKLEEYSKTDQRAIDDLMCELDQIKAENEEIETKIKKESQEIQIEEEKIKEMFQSEDKEFTEDLADLEKIKSSLEEDIYKIKHELEEKMKSLQSVCDLIEEKETKIQNISQKYYNASGIDCKKKIYNEHLMMLHNANDIFEMKKNQLKKKEDILEKKNQEINEALTLINDSLVKYKHIEDELENDLTMKCTNLFKEKEDIDSLISLSNILGTLKKKTNDNIENIQKLEFQNKRIESEILAIDIKIPNLEEEKKTMIAKKTFKEAQNIALEIKSLLDSKSQLNERILNVRKQITVLQEENMINNELADGSIKQIERINKEMNIRRNEYLGKYKSLIMSLINDSTPEQDNSTLIEELNFLEEELRMRDVIGINKGSEKEMHTEEKCQEQEDQQNNENDHIEDQAKDPIVAKSQIEELEKQLEECIQEEDYQKADELNSVIEELKKQISN